MTEVKESLVHFPYFLEDIFFQFIFNCKFNIEVDTVDPNYPQMMTISWESHHQATICARVYTGTIRYTGNQFFVIALTWYWAIFTKCTKCSLFQRSSMNSTKFIYLQEISKHAHQRPKIKICIVFRLLV